jgi:inhibitor of KinA
MLRYIPSGDSALIIKTGDDISEATNREVRKLLTRLEQEDIPGIVDFIPSYNELMICYDPLKCLYDDLIKRIHDLENDIEKISLKDNPAIGIPVLYGGESGPDLGVVAGHNNLSEDEVIKIHSSGTYLVYMLGFTPGFCYLGGMDPCIATPRRHDPRIRIAAGSVGIADNQTGIYPLESPGGWQLIGKTPLRLFDQYRTPEFLIEAGDKIRFYPVGMEEFEKIMKNADELTELLIKGKRDNHAIGNN